MEQKLNRMNRACANTVSCNTSMPGSQKMMVIMRRSMVMKMVLLALMKMVVVMVMEAEIVMEMLVMTNF